MSQNNKIYVAIASYRDPLLNSTIKSLYVNANNPENITVGCFIQSYEQDRAVETPLKQFTDPQVNWEEVYYQTVNPGSIFSITECRNNALQFLPDDVTYVLQVDSHTRFSKDWDLSLLNYIKDLPEKSAISTYLPGWQPLPTGEEIVKINNGFFEPNFTTLTKDNLINNGEIIPENLPVKSDNKFLHKSWYLAAHFIFARKELFKCINQQNWVMFWGEEFVNSLSAASEGWDVYLPYDPPLAHMYPQDVEAYLSLNKLFKDFPEEWRKNTSRTTTSILNMLNNVEERQGFNQSGVDKINKHLGYDLTERLNNFLKDS
jgi:hypothetical protein